jgi:hypothetical protein
MVIGLDCITSVPIPSPRPEASFEVISLTGSLTDSGACVSSGVEPGSVRMIVARTVIDRGLILTLGDS